MSEDSPSSEKQPEKKKGVLEGLSFFRKVVLFLLILTLIFIAWSFLFGGVNSIWELAFVIVLTGVIIFVGWLIITSASFFFRKEFYSPKQDFYTRVANAAIDFCPKNLNNLYFQGDNYKKSVLAGKIIGCLGIPYFIGTPIIDKETGNPKMYESKLLKKEVPLFSKIEYGKDGDTYIIVEKGWFVFKKRYHIRANRNLHSTLNGDVFIYDINPIPYGSHFLYPFKQLQGELPKVMIQSQMEVIIATHEHQGDLISQAADSAIYYNPFFRLVEKERAEIARQ